MTPLPDILWGDRETGTQNKRWKRNTKNTTQACRKARLFELHQVLSVLCQTRQFDWSSDIQGIVLSSFTYGYIATQLLAGYLCLRFGAKRTMFCGIALSAAATLLSPLAAVVTPHLLITAQVLDGFGQVRVFAHNYAFGCTSCEPLVAPTHISDKYDSVIAGITFFEDPSTTLVRVGNVDEVTVNTEHEILVDDILFSALFFSDQGVYFPCLFHLWSRWAPAV